MSWFKKLLTLPSKNNDPSPPDQTPSTPDSNGNVSSPAVPSPSGQAESAPVEAPAICQIEAKSKYPFAKKKVIAATAGADGKPVYTESQLDRTLQKLSDRKKARKKARDEEKQYVEFRKQEILAQFRPTVGALRSGDEAFPKRRRGTMGFGERKAYYLSVRPNPKYAVWLGKKKEKVRQAKIIAPTPIETVDAMTDHSAIPQVEQSKRDVERDAESQRDQKPKTHEECQTKTESLTDKTSGTPDSSKSDKPKKKKEGKQKEKSKKKEKTQGEKKGNNAQNPIVNGVPFWMHASPSDQDEITEDDLPIDVDLLEKVVKGELKLDHPKHIKCSFNPFSGVQHMKKDNSLFNRATIIFANTVESVIALQPDDNVRPLPPQAPKLITWKGTLSVTTFDPLNRLPREKRTPFTEALKDLRREKKGK
uniref:Serine/threonine-protein kinase n=2 Tax=Steinernema glaseri TaxID=37863 RepID=A0A1I7YXQ1_9BILA